MEDWALIRRLAAEDAGLRLPDDITTVWANDSFGHIRRLPSEAEKRRDGGHGLYYHSSYWSDYTSSYLATSSTPLALMKSELRKAWNGGIHRLWVNNIGGLKPLELEMEFFLRSAWEAGKETTTVNVQSFTARWIDSKLSGGHGTRAGEIYARYYSLNNQRKIEHLTADVFPQVGHGDEAGRRLGELRRLHDETNEILTSLPADEQDAFFELFAMKIQMAYLTSAEFYYADRSTLCQGQGKPAAADSYLEVSRSFGRSIRALIHHYNHGVAGGRWSGMFTPHEFPPPVMPLYPAATPALEVGEPGLGVTVWGASAPEPAPEIRFWPNGLETKWLEVSNRGAGAIRYEIRSDPWIEVGQDSGNVETEQRISVRINDAARHAGRVGSIHVTCPDTGEAVEISVSVEQSAPVPPAFVGAFEADGYVCLDPSLPDCSIPGASSCWVVVPHLGRYGNGVIQPEPVGSQSATTNAASIEFGVHLSTPGAHLLELHRLPTLNSTGRLRVAVSVDGQDPVVVESPTTDEHRGSWSSAILDNVEKLRVRLPRLDAGAHRLVLHAIDDHFALSKLVVHTGEPVASNLGPGFSTHSRRGPGHHLDPDPSALSADEVDAEAARLYGVDPGTLPAPDVLYVDRDFWDRDATFLVAPKLPQTPTAADVPRRGYVDEATWERAAGIDAADGVVAFEAELALANTAVAWLTPAPDSPDMGWVHTQAETDGGKGLAMHVRPRGILFDDPEAAPAMHYSLSIRRSGIYRVWLLVKFDDARDDSCVIAVDGTAQPLEEQFSRGEMCEYGLRQRWLWAQISDVHLASGERTFSIHARKSGLRVDRVYLTLGDELPPSYGGWVPSPPAVSAPGRRDI